MLPLPASVLHNGDIVDFGIPEGMERQSDPAVGFDDVSCGIRLHFRRERHLRDPLHGEKSGSSALCAKNGKRIAGPPVQSSLNPA